MNNVFRKCYFAKRIKSFKFAIHGLLIIIRQEPNFRIHLIAFAVAIAAGIRLRLSANEWTMLLFVSFAVLISETINSALELLCDYISPQKNKTIGIIKDISAAAVLISAIAALIIGGIIFVPKII